MSPLKWILPVVCLAGTLNAQSLGDLNGLIGSASRFVHEGLSGTPHAKVLELCRVIGDNGGNEESPMNRSVDVVHWQFQYRIDVGSEIATPKPPHSVLAECNRGVFGGLQYSEALVTEAKTLEHTWVGIPLEDAIDALRNAGFNRGFDQVTLTRPDNSLVPDEYVYIFDCPFERFKVAISTQTGELAWKSAY